MSWSINITGHDTLEGAAKSAFENHLVSITLLFAEQLKKINDVTITKGVLKTDTHEKISLIPETVATPKVIHPGPPPIVLPVEPPIAPDSLPVAPQPEAIPAENV